MFDLEEILRNTLKAKCGKQRQNIRDAALESLLEGGWLDEEMTVFRSEYRYQLPLQQGTELLERFCVPEVIQRWAGIDKKIKLDELLFYDTETTGLSGGVGTWIFLMGTGRFLGDEFILRQYFMTEPGVEERFLVEVEKEFAEDIVPVSFNGRSYDANLLNTRCIMNGRNPFLAGMADIDLLYPARRLWRRKLGKCNLNHLEEQLLGVLRGEEDDLPSGDIPQLYFDYLESGQVGLLERVFNHNRTDILSLPVLFGMMAKIIEGDLKQSYDKQAISRLFYDQGMGDKAVSFLIEGLNGEDATGCRKQLSYHYKRQGRYLEAVELWQKADNEIYALEELAKYFEHKLNEFDKALEVTNKALEIIFDNNYVDGRLAVELQKRKSRLLRKITRIDNG